MAHYREAPVTTLVIWVSSDSGHRWTNLIGFLWIHFWFCRVYFDVCLGSHLWISTCYRFERERFVVKLFSHVRFTLNTSNNVIHKMNVNKKKERKKEKTYKNKLTWPRLKPYTFAYEKRRYEHCARYAERYAKFCIKIHLMRIEKL